MTSGYFLIYAHLAMCCDLTECFLCPYAANITKPCLRKQRPKTKRNPLRAMHSGVFLLFRFR